MKFETSEKNVLSRLLDEKAAKNKDKPFLYFEDEEMTFYVKPLINFPRR